MVSMSLSLAESRVKLTTRSIKNGIERQNNCKRDWITQPRSCTNSFIIYLDPKHFAFLLKKIARASCQLIARVSDQLESLSFFGHCAHLLFTIFEIQFALFSLSTLATYSNVEILVNGAKKNELL